MEYAGLTKKYGIIRFHGTLMHNANHVLVFESDDAVEAMRELELRCAEDDPHHGYMLVVRQNS